MKITKSQLKEIIKEEASRLQKKTILENRKKAIVREMRMLNEEVEGDKSILETLYIKLPFLKDGTITEDEWSFLKKYDEFLNDVNSKEDYINYLSKVSDESYDQENIETLHSYKAFDTLEDAVKLIVKEINPKFHVWFSENVELRDGNDKNVLTISDENDNLTKIPVTAKLKELNGNNLNEEEGDVAVDKVKEAFSNSDESYLKKSLEQRNPGKDSAGSTFLKALSIDELINADWEPYNHPNISSPAIGFKASIPGKLGVAEMKSLPKDLKVKFQPAHKGAGEGAEAVAEIPESNLLVKHTTLILGPKGDGLTVWTFFPGDATPKSDPISIDKVKNALGGEGDVLYGTVEDAINLGFNFAKNGSTSLNESIRKIVREGIFSILNESVSNKIESIADKHCDDDFNWWNLMGDIKTALKEHFKNCDCSIKDLPNTDDSCGIEITKGDRSVPLMIKYDDDRGENIIKIVCKDSDETYNYEILSWENSGGESRGYDAFGYEDTTYEEEGVDCDVKNNIIEELITDIEEYLDKKHNSIK
jgi:hypothetical protein